jgi:hypothetical protein
MIWTFEQLGLVWNVKPVPQRVLDLGRNKKGTDTTESVEVSQHQAA